ncbi:MAG: transglutaminaseTgpA domain-containing protein, partial [Acidimicrobiales bacterium]
MSGQPQRSLLPAAEAGLVLVSLASVLTFWRLFADRSFLVPLATLAIAAHLVMTLCRRSGIGLPVTGVVAAVAAAFTHAWVLYPATTTYGVPTSRTLDVVTTDLEIAWDQFFRTVPPVPVETGYLVAAGVAIWVGIFIADWAAFRLWVPFEAVVPAGTLWLFASLLGADNSRASATALFAAAVLAFILLHRTVRQQFSASWLASDVDRGTAALLRVGGWLVTGALVIGAVAGPLLPGADAESLVPWRDWGDNEGGRQTVNPLASVLGKLTNRSSAELFTVELQSPDERSYWRLTALDQFDGLTWRANWSPGDADGSLPDRYPTAAPVTVAEHRFTISGLGDLWLPAAFEPKTIRAVNDSIEAIFDEESSMLMADRGYESVDGAVYLVQSELPRHDEAALAAASNADLPEDITGEYLDLPGGFSQRVRDLAAEITGDADTPYQQARALQDWFRDNYAYDLDASYTGGGAMESFLFDGRVGMCQQFSSSYAAMARAIGLPARVAIGFTTGEPDPANPNLYHVRGEHSHAWPEVFIAGYGWVPFEPTPNRGIPGAEAYTGVPEQQAAPGDPGAAIEVPSQQNPVDLGEGQPTEQPGLEPDGGLEDVGAAGSGETDPAKPSLWEQWDHRLAWGAAIIVGLAVLYLILVPMSHWVRRRARRGRASTP